MSTFTWLDHSEADRRRMLEVIQLFREPGTLDELGIGSVRDALADRLFPGTTTIQTRAKYFLFVPWIYRNLELRKVPSRRIVDRARADETQLMKALARNHPGEKGIIGISAGANLKRLPSNIYWRGLQVWGLLSFTGSQYQFHQSLDSFYAISHQHRQSYGDEEERGPRVHNWRPSLPDPPDAFPDEASLYLTQDESQYLVERIVTRVSESALASLIRIDHSDLSIRFPWQHPQFGELPAVRQEELQHAHNFSEVIHGAQLLYNYMLAEKWSSLGNGDERLEEYRSRITKWAEQLAVRQEQLAHWDWQVRFWQLVEDTNPGIHQLTRAFIIDWLGIILVENSAHTVVDNVGARRLISDREAALKRRSARLHNSRALELWSGESGADQLNYRWNVVQTLLGDISRGLYRQSKSEARLA